jgi:hypothetical protein
MLIGVLGPLRVEVAARRRSWKWKLAGAPAFFTAAAQLAECGKLAVPTTPRRRPVKTRASLSGGHELRRVRAEHN